MNLESSVKISPLEIAKERCNAMIDWYDNHKDKDRLRFHIFQTSSIILSGITPVLIILPDLPDVWKALPAALAAISTGLLGIYQWKEKYVRYAYTAQALRSERLNLIPVPQIFMDQILMIIPPCKTL